MKHINLLKATQFETVAAWFKSLDLRTKDEIIREGNINEPNIFIRMWKVMIKVRATWVFLFQYQKPG